MELTAQGTEAKEGTWKATVEPERPRTKVEPEGRRSPLEPKGWMYEEALQSQWDDGPW